MAKFTRLYFSVVFISKFDYQCFKEISIDLYSKRRKKCVVLVPKGNILERKQSTIEDFLAELTCFSLPLRHVSFAGLLGTIPLCAALYASLAYFCGTKAYLLTACMHTHLHALLRPPLSLPPFTKVFSESSTSSRVLRPTRKHRKESTNCEDD